jgi:hypothetical protein
MFIALVLTFPGPLPCRIESFHRFQCRPPLELAVRPKRPPKTALKLVRTRSCCDERCPFLAGADAPPRRVAAARFGFSRSLNVTGPGVQEGGKWPDKAAECVFRDDHALRMYQREGVNWLVFNWCACFRWAFSLTPCSFKLPTVAVPARWRIASAVQLRCRRFSGHQSGKVVVPAACAARSGSGCGSCRLIS